MNSKCAIAPLHPGTTVDLSTKEVTNGPSRLITNAPLQEPFKSLMIAFSIASPKRGSM